ncbi:hypothetical protein QBC47DRAFT_410622 [Echria macrotheca]|uniref:Uncharacterized protein n=1 Tax=Echria macrotheca TaxID=438768 RepID=A0AAJ0BMG8_9PEZI|nr:hypothetical protein QBC47DRAFT_410622 [Echria macrotheca]
MSHQILSSLSVLFSLIESANAPPTPETVVVSGPGVSNHGKENVVCFPTKVTAILTFFAFNYVAHAASIKVPPAGSSASKLFVGFLAFFNPAYGFRYAVDGMFRWCWHMTKKFPYCRMDPLTLETAHQAGALVTVIRSPDWKPAVTDRTIRDLRAKSAAYLHYCGPTAEPFIYECVVENRYQGVTTTIRDAVLSWKPKIHGGFDLPSGYSWVTVHRVFKLRPFGRSTPSPGPAPAAGGQNEPGEDILRLDGTYSIIKPLTAAVQMSSAVVTLFRAVGDEIDRYGFTAFGLTVVPYLVMTLFNLLALLATPEYTTFYAVWSEVYAEAAARANTQPRESPLVELIPSGSTDDELFPAEPSQQAPDGPLLFNRLTPVRSFTLPPDFGPDAGQRFKIPGEPDVGHPFRIEPQVNPLETMGQMRVPSLPGMEVYSEVHWMDTSWGRLVTGTPCRVTVSLV